MRIKQSLTNCELVVIERTRQLMNDKDFREKHRLTPKAFTRQRRLGFTRVLVLILQKSIRSIQLHLHDFFQHLADDGPVLSVSASAWTQARSKLSHTAFIELNQHAVLLQAYGKHTDWVVKRWRDFRVLAVDSSLLRLPKNTEVGQAFGWVECENQKGECGRYTQGRLSVMYDVLNHIAVHTLLEKWTVGERGLAAVHLAQSQEGDLLVLDRGYCSYEWLARCVKEQRYFVCRCPGSSFGEANRLLAGKQAGKSSSVFLQPPNGRMGEVRQIGLPEEIQVRFVTVALPDGQLEVLATSLLDEGMYPTESFGELYRLRWGIETYYGLLKSRLDLENFSGRSVESVRQDIYATVFLSNLESIVVRSAREELSARSHELRQPSQVNRAVSFHSLKTHLWALLLSEVPAREVLEKIQRLCLANPNSVRRGRIVPRKKISAWRSYHFQRTTKKAVF
jgi:hypothetical protein